MNSITIIDYGLSNLLSVQHVFNYLNVDCKITNLPDDIINAKALILPGVGAFSDGMKALKNLGLIDSLNASVKKGVPLLGICLGMQMLFEKSEEFGIHDGLGYIPGQVAKIPSEDLNGEFQKVPHISWDPLYPVDISGNFNNTILDKIDPGDECYFIHSYEAIPTYKEHIVANTVYGGRKICAVAQNGNVIGTQFHPEKSGIVGLNIVNSFVEKYFKK